MIDPPVFQNARLWTCASVHRSGSASDKKLEGEAPFLGLHVLVDEVAVAGLGLCGRCGGSGRVGRFFEGIQMPRAQSADRSPCRGGKRELVIGQGNRGCVALHRWLAGIETVFVLALRAQRESGFKHCRTGRLIGIFLHPISRRPHAARPVTAGSLLLHAWRHWTLSPRQAQPLRALARSRQARRRRIARPWRPRLRTHGRCFALELRHKSRAVRLHRRSRRRSQAASRHWWPAGP